MALPRDGRENPLTAALRQCVCEVLTVAIEKEVEAYLEARVHIVVANECCLMVRKGYTPPRRRQTRLGEGLVRERRPGEAPERFRTGIPQPYPRSTKSPESPFSREALDEVPGCARGD